MSIQSLDEDQIASMTLEEKDRWWLEKIYRGNMPQLTLRSILTGMILGSVLSLTNLYVGIRTGWTLGVGITSVVLSFGIFKLLAKMNLGREMTILENNAMQSIATSAGYMTGPLISSVPAYMMVTGQIVPTYQVLCWVITLSLMGVLFAFPLKRRFINDEQLPFPEGYAAAVVMDGLHSDVHGKEGFFKAKVLMFAAAFSALVEILRSNMVMEFFRLKFLAIPHYWDEFIYKYYTPQILGTPLKDLTIRFDSSIVMLGIGGLLGIKTGTSLLIGAIFNYAIVAPYLIREGIIKGPGFGNITIWALWGGVALMTTSSLFSFFANPQIIKGLFRKRTKSHSSAVLKDIELPVKISLIGVPLLGILAVWMGHVWFDISWMLGIIAIPLVFIFTIIAVNSTGLTSITPTGALGKLTQVTFSLLAPGKVTTNLMTASITSEVASNASNLLMDIKPGYLLGAKPRQQAIGHVLGIFAGGITAVPVFYALFHGDISLFTSETLPLPTATVWRAVAEMLTNGFSMLHVSAKYAIVIGAVLGLVLEIIHKKNPKALPISAVGLGLAFVIPFQDSFMMALGAFLFHFLKPKDHGDQSVQNDQNQSRDPVKNYSLSWWRQKIFGENSETVCAGLIAGGALIGITLILLENLG